MRFVFVSFLFLGWAFYELSGGADFEPRQKPDLQSAAAGSNIRMVADQQVVVPDPVRVTRLSPLPEVATLSARPATVPVEQETPAVPRIDLALVHATGSVAQNADADGKVVLASLADGSEAFSQPRTMDTSLAVEPQPALPATDAEPSIAAPEPVVIYHITGSRVNLRQGPGTTYTVTGTLFYDDQVEVLQDPDIGWVQLRNVDDGRIGWMASRFVGRPVEQ